MVFDFQSGLSQKRPKSFRPGGNSEIADDNQRLVLTENKFGQIAEDRFFFAAGQPGKIDIDENQIPAACFKSQKRCSSFCGQPQLSGAKRRTAGFDKRVEPLRLLFKDEVRQLGRELGLPEYLVSRQPFPGPGLAIRIIGDITQEKVAIVQDADAIWREEVDKLPAAQRPSQYFAALTNMRSVGVMGDERTYDYAIALRAVTTTDFMTAEVTLLPTETITTAANRIVNEVKHINRVLFDYTTKPPATIEFE